MRKNEPVSNVLIKRAEQIRSATEILIAKTNDWQMIKQFLCNRLEDMQLTEVQQSKLERYQFIYNQLVSCKYTDQDVLNMLMKSYGIKVYQAYEDMKCARELFTAVININKRFELQIELQSAKDMKRKCVEIGDFKTAGAIQKNIVAIMAMLPDEEDNPAELFEGHEIEAVFDPKLLGAPDVNMKEVLAAINAKRKVAIKTDLFENIPYEETTSL
jgi:hypothetical protein